MKKKGRLNGTLIAIWKVPVMYRQLEESGEPTKSRHPARATANEAALKRERPVGGVCSRYGGKTTGHDLLGGQ